MKWTKPTKKQLSPNQNMVASLYCPNCEQNFLVLHAYLVWESAEEVVVWKRKPRSKPSHKGRKKRLDKFGKVDRQEHSLHKSFSGIAAMTSALNHMSIFPPKTDLSRLSPPSGADILSRSKVIFTCHVAIKRLNLS